MKNPWAEIQPPNADVNARRVDHTHPVDLFWGRSQTGRYLLVCELPVATDLSSMEIPSVVGIRAWLSIDNDDSSPKKLCLELRDETEWEMFVSICLDIVEATRTCDQHTVAPVVIRRLARWQQFLKHRGGEGLSESAVKGLFGEMAFLKSHVTDRFGLADAIRFWRGPLGAPQDFEVHDTAIEVKCQVATSSQCVSISSIDQMCPQVSKMFLHVITIASSEEDAPGATCLPTMVDDVRKQAQAIGSETVEDLEDRLLACGYSESDAERYRRMIFIQVAETTYRVVEGFPRICPSIVPGGVIRLTYSVELAACAGFEGRPDWMVGQA
jgi:hypothetical protein